MTAEIVAAYRCLECEHVAEETAGSLYECSRCGTIFTQDTSADGGSNRCPQCNIFGAKIADDACAECNEGEVEQITAVEIDGDLIEVDGDGSVEEMVGRAIAAKAEERRQTEELTEYKAREEQRRRDEVAALPSITAAEVRPGDVLVYHDPNSHWDKFPEFTVGRAAPDESEPGRIRLAPPGGMGFQFVCDPGDLFKLKERPAETPDNEPSLEERLRAEFKS